MTNITSPPFKRLILRAVSNDVSPIVARVFSISDDVEITELHDVFLSMLGWQHDLGFIIRVHGQEFNSYQRRSRGKRVRDFQLRRQEKLLYICNTLDLWEWEIRLLDIQDGNADERDPECLDGRGVVPPESCGGPRGYRLMLKRQAAGPRLSDPATIAASVKLLAQVYGDDVEIDWQSFRRRFANICRQRRRKWSRRSARRRTVYLRA